MGGAARDLLANADLLHVHEFRTVENLIVTPIAARLGVPVVLSPHGTLSLTTGRGALKSAWDRLLSPSVARRIAAVIGLTAAGSRRSARGVGVVGCERAPVSPSSPTASIRRVCRFERARSLSGALRLGRCGGLPVHGALAGAQRRDVLVRAFKQANVAGARLVIAGPDEGMLPALQALPTSA